MNLLARINTTIKCSDYAYGLLGLITQKKYEPCNEVFYVNHARTGIRLALSSLNLPEKSRVGVTAYNCLTVMNAITEAGHSPVFIDINEKLQLDLSDLQAKKEKIHAIIVTHLFGISNDVAAIRNCCPDIPIIEDCAHAYLSMYQNKKVGLEGDFAVYSIGQGKFPSIGNGGLLRVNNPKYTSAISSLYQQLSMNTIRGEMSELLFSALKSFLSLPGIYPFVRPFKLKSIKSNKTDQIYKHIEKKMNRYVYTIYGKKKSHCELYVKIQQENAFRVLTEIQYIPSLQPIPIDTQNYNCFMFVVFTKNRDELIDFFVNRGIEVGSHFSRSIEWASNFGYEIGSCPVSEKATKELMMIPIHYNLNKGWINKIVKILNELK